MTDLIGRTLGVYQVEALLGMGPAGPRLAARHTRLQRPAALRLFTSLANRPEERRRLLAGLRQAAALNHPRIVEIFDVGEAGDQLFVAAELLPGGSLRNLLQRLRAEQGRLPLVAALAMGQQVAEGVAAAHRQGVVHAAISPDALRLVSPVRSDETPPPLKIDDFGLAQLFPDEAPLAYRAPEQWTGAAITPRTDVYALGVLLYELTVGVPPFNVATPEQAAEKHLRARPVPPRMVRPQLPAALEAVVLRCLAKAPEDRFADAGELFEALRQLAATLPGAPAPAAAPPPPAVTPAVKATVTPAAGAAFGAAAGAAAGAAGAASGFRALPPLDDDDPLLAGLLGTPSQGSPAYTSPAYTSPAVPPVEPSAPTVAAAAVTGPQIAVELDQEQVGLVPGRPNFVNVRLVNRGDAPDTVTLSVDGVPGAWIRDIDIPVRLAPGQASVMPIVVEPASGSRGEAGDYNALIRARSVADQTLSATARMRWTVLPLSAASLSIAPPAAEGTSDGEYTLTLRNEGNAQATYLISADDRGRQLGYIIGQGEVTLGPGQSARIPLVVEAQRRYFGGRSEHPFTVYAEPESGDVATAEATFAQRAVLPAWLPLLAAALLIGLVALGFVLQRQSGLAGGANPTPGLPTPFPTPLPGAPVIAAFTVEPPVVAPGQPVTLFWDVRGAQRVRIEQLGDVESLGSSEFRPEQTTDFRLIAFAGDLQTDRIVRVLVAPPTPIPTDVPQPTLVPAPTAAPLPTATVPPAATVAPPPAATAVPTIVPTIVPTTVPATAPPAEATALPTAGSSAAPASIDLLTLAPSAQWSSSVGPLVFGPSAPGAEANGQATLASNLTLEDRSSAAIALLMLPPVPAPDQTQITVVPYVQAIYQIPLVQAGQGFVADVGFAQGDQSPPLKLLVTFENNIVFEGEVRPTGRLTRIRGDLSRFVGLGGRLELRVSAENGPATAPVYWVAPRIDVPPAR